MRSAAVIAGLAAGLLAAELSARLYLLLSAGPKAPPAVSVPEDAYVRYDPELGWSTMPSLRRGWLTTDSRGLRHPLEPVVPKPAGLKRLLVLGDSFTFGPEVRDEATYTAMLGARLGPGYEVLNAGVVAYGVDQMLLTLERWGKQLQPDLVVLVAIAEDFCRATMDLWPSGHARPKFSYEGGRLIRPRFPLPRRISPGRPLEPRRAAALGPRPVLLGLLQGRGLAGQGELRAASMDSLPEVSRALLVAARDRARETGAEFLVVLLPREESLRARLPLREDLRRFCRAEGIALLDLHTLFLKTPGREPLTSHPRPADNALIAWALHERLRAMPRLGPPRAGRPLAEELAAAAPKPPAPARRPLNSEAFWRLFDAKARRGAPPAELRALALERVELLLEAEEPERALRVLERLGAAPFRGGADERTLRLRRRARHAQVLRRQALGDWSRAAAALEPLARSGTDAAVWSDLGVALAMSGRRAEARRAFKRALELDPRLETARVSLRALD